jgi:hypothetical protein
VRSGGFHNLVKREQLGAYVAAGVAAARLSWSVTLLDQLPRQMAMAREWLRSGKRDLKTDSMELLELLYTLFPQTPNLGQELVLAYLECDKEEKASALLARLEKSMRNPSEEMLSRWGRIYKDNGDRYAGLPDAVNGVQTTNSVSAIDYYQHALQWYGRAYRIRNGHYPGINRATLLFMIGCLSYATSQSSGEQYVARATAAAHELLDHRTDWPLDQDDDRIWHPATEAEARLLLGEWEAAASLYREALILAGKQGFYSESMRKQVDRILYCFRLLGEAGFGPFDDVDKVFRTED